MRASVVGALFVLLLVVLARGLVELERTGAAEGERGTWVLLVSRGALLPASAELDPGDQVDAAILAGDRTFGPEGALEALLVQVFDANGRPDRRARFGRLAEARELAAFVAALVPGEFLALAHAGDVVAPSARDGVAALLFDLGARRSPTEGSWAFVAERTATGWRALGESASATSGVTLSTHLPSAREREPLVEREEAAGPARITLTRERPALARDAAPLAAAELAGGAFEAWSVLATGAADGPALAWGPLPLGRGTTLTLGVGVRRTDGNVLVRAVVTPVDGGEARSWDLVLGRDRAGAWTPLVVDLAEFDGRAVTLAFDVRPARADATVEVLFARPTVAYESDP